MPPQQQQSGDEAAKIMQAISAMLSNVGKQTQSPSGPTSVPGTVPATPSSTIQFNPNAPRGPVGGAPAPQLPQVPRTGSESIGDFGSHGAAVNAGLVSLGNSLSGIFNTVEQKDHAKKAALAENYLMQINGLLASGDPNDKKKAEMILEDPKIRKILKTGLEYVPLEEEVPPEAHGVQSAIRKIGGQGGQGGQPQKRPVIPQASSEQQLKSAITNALLQKIKQDPASAISMMGQSQMSSAEQHADELYKSMGLSPGDIARMSSAEKMQGIKTYEAATVAAIKGEIDMYKAQLEYKGKVDSAKILGNARKYVADTVKNTKDKNGKPNSYAAGAKIYEDYAKKYLDIIKGGKGPDGKPLTDEQIKQYQQKADAYQQQADQYLNQAGDLELMEMFQKAIEEEPEEKPEEQPK